MQEIRTNTPRYAGRSDVSLLSTLNYGRFKRFADIMLAFSLIVLFGLVMLLVAMLVKMTSSGPILYRQTRVGRRGQLFQMLKFRSMRTGNNSDAHRAHVQRLIRENTSAGTTSLKLTNDPRITAVGKYIRKLSLDELPQLFNVLRGDMSLVGPRPPLPYEYELYSPLHKQRLQVAPGITGLWQVTGRNRVSFEEMVALDLTYIAAMSLWLDLKIMLLTPIEMLWSRGGG
ncbi:MAG: hypothetical protein NVSMB42_24490 [Herpetosiphon sp.]